MENAYIELAGHQIESENHGAPQCPAVIQNQNVHSYSEPLAWSHDVNGQTVWYYNYPAALAEAKYLQKKIPTIDEWTEMLNTVNGSAKDKADTLHMPLAGFRHAETGVYYAIDEYANFWTSSQNSDKSSTYVYLGATRSDASSDWYGTDVGLPIRLMA